jgi:hypothetical protein
MAYKLVIENTVKVPVKFDLNNGGKTTSFDFKVICERLTQSEITATIEDQDEKIKDFVCRVAKGWSGQTLVVEEDGTPAEFNDESLAVMLDVATVAHLIFNSYLKECGAKEKNLPKPQR